MNPISLVRKATFLLVSMCVAFSGISQSLYPVPLDTKVRRSTLIVEGRVFSQQSSWNPQHTMIYTSSKVEVYKIFKGTIAEDTIEIMTQGGTVGNTWESVTELLQLHTGEAGLFFCYPNQLNLVSPVSGRVLYDIYGRDRKSVV